MPEKTLALTDYPWRITYRTSNLDENGRPLDILHQFYIPALTRSVRYDRVAGYFRSTSLAVASQGFTAFIRQQGKVRLIVGADLDPRDVQTILQGADKLLIEKLCAQLELGEQAQQETLCGLELLAYMISCGLLEIRVAFRVHAKTGQPLDPDSTADGYVHEKWALFSDAQGHHLYASGSLNESRTALVLNAENIDVHCGWHGGTDQLRVQEAQIDFQRMWNNQHPSLRVLSLPEAVREKLISFVPAGDYRPVEIDGSSAAPKTHSVPSALERLKFALLRDGPLLPGGRFVGMETAPIEPWPHQAVVARRLIETWPYSYLLCDEVGLGKTIEAGLVFRSLYLSGLAKRILICPPASLTAQWQREMAEKFLLPFARARSGAAVRHDYLLPLEENRSAASLYEPDLVIVSHGLVARKERYRDLRTAAAFDIALVDEAHYARRQNPTQGTKAHPRYGQLFETLRDHLRDKTKSLLLATATPMQLDPVEVSDLLSLIPRVGAFQYDPTLVALYYEVLGKLVSGRKLGVSEADFLRRAVLSTQDQDPLFWRFVEAAVIDGRTRLAARRWLEQGRLPNSRSEQLGLQRLIFAAAPLSRVMLRHTRSLLEIYRAQGRLGANLARREVLRIPDIRFNALERQVDAQLERYCTGLTTRLARNKDTKTRGAVGFLQSFFRLRFASSLYAFSETVRRRRERVDYALNYLDELKAEELEDFELADLLDEADEDTTAICAFLKNRTRQDLEWERGELSIMEQTLKGHSGPSSKMHVLLTVLDKRRITGTGRIHQTVIFTRFFDTLTDIVRRLQQADPLMRIGTYSGQGGQYFDPRSARMLGIGREEVKHRFLRNEIDILVCTDAAAEGLNLQTADLLVNFDLPWNPMKVEQRIGRIDRIGQKHGRISVLNLCYLGSAEQIVYGRLLERLTQAGAIVGTQQLSLLPVTLEEFQLLAEKKLDPQELENRARERAVLARQRTESMEIPAQDLFSIYERLEQASQQSPSPVTLDAIWEILSTSVFLRELGCEVMSNQEKKTLTVANLPGVIDGTPVTTSRDVVEKGLEGYEGRPHFASYGDSVFEALLNHMGSFELPGCIHRISVELAGTDAQRVGYAVAVQQPDGGSGCKLVTNLVDLQGLVLDEGAGLSDNDTAPLKRTLAELISREHQAVQAVARIEQINTHTAWSQILLGLLVAQGAIATRLRLGMAEPTFWREIAALEDLVRNQDTLYIPKVPVSVARHASHPLFPLSLPVAGDETPVSAPQPLMFSAVEGACRLADSLRVKRAELVTEDFLGRVTKEMGRIVNKLT